MNGEWVATRPFKHDKYPCDMLNAVREVVYNPSRVRYPMVRLDWLRQREKSDRRQRGDNRFVRVSWDRALDLFYEELERVQKPTALPACLPALPTGKWWGNIIRLAGRWIEGWGYMGAM